MIFMKKTVIYPALSSQAVDIAAHFLASQGIAVTNTPGDATHYLYPVPTPRDIVPPAGITVIGGNLDHLGDVPKLDLLQDMGYLAKNAAITAHCAIRLAADHLPDIFQELPALVIGWGRIGKCLAAQLKAAGCRVQVAARRESDRAMLEALGYQAISMARLPQAAEKCRLLFNTAPAPVLQTGHFSCVKIDLASVRGLDGSDVIWARGLPGKMAPEAAGRLVGETVARQLKEEEA